jgi:hypothetical protein
MMSTMCTSHIKYALIKNLRKQGHYQGLYNEQCKGKAGNIFTSVY